MAITAQIIDAVKVQFIEPIFEDDFVEPGMKAWLTKVEYHENISCYKLFFNFTEFEAENDKYFTESFYPNVHTRSLGLDKPLYTAKEARMYSARYDVYFSVSTNLARDDAAFAQEILLHLREIE